MWEKYLLTDCLGDRGKNLSRGMETVHGQTPGQECRAELMTPDPAEDAGAAGSLTDKPPAALQRDKALLPAL